jgi:hypothetical protein
VESEFCHATPACQNLIAGFPLSSISNSLNIEADFVLKLDARLLLRLKLHVCTFGNIYMSILSYIYISACRIIIIIMHNLQQDIFILQSLYMCLQTEECLKTIFHHPLENTVAYVLRRNLWVAAFKLMQQCHHNLLCIHHGWKLLTIGIHDENSVTERVSKSVQMLLPVKMNT